MLSASCGKHLPFLLANNHYHWLHSFGWRVYQWSIILCHFAGCSHHMHSSLLLGPFRCMAEVPSQSRDHTTSYWSGCPWSDLVYQLFEGKRSWSGGKSLAESEKWTHLIIHYHIFIFIAKKKMRLLVLIACSLFWVSLGQSELTTDVPLTEGVLERSRPRPSTVPN